MTKQSASAIRTIRNFGACNEKAWCPLVVQIVLATDYMKAPMDSNHSDGLNFMCLPLVRVRQEDEDHPVGYLVL